MIRLLLARDGIQKLVITFVKVILQDTALLNSIIIKVIP